MRLLIVSDLHLDAVTAGVERFDDVAASVDHVVDTAIGLRVDLFVFLGDLCNPGTSRSHRAVAHAASAVMRLAAEGIPSAWLAGNHDVVEDGHGTTTLAPLAEAFPDMAAVVTVPTHGLMLGGLPFVALPYTARSHDYDPEEVAAQSVNALMKKRGEWLAPPVVLGHLWLQGAIEGGEAQMPRGRELCWPMNAAGLFKLEMVEPLMINGHYHAKGRVHDVHIPGSPQRLTFGEEDNACGYLVAESDGSAWEVKQVAGSARPLATVAPGDKIWTAKRLAKKRINALSAEGAIVRLQPPAGGQERAEKLRDALMVAGAAAVKLEPPEAEDAVVVGDEPAEEAGSHREVILAMVEEANTEDRDALRAVVEDAMDAEGV